MSNRREGGGPKSACERNGCRKPPTPPRVRLGGALNKRVTVIAQAVER